MNAGLIAVIVALAAAVAGALVYARRAWLLSTALERQLTDTRAQRDAQHREGLERIRIAGERIEAQIGRMRDETGLRLENAERSINQAANRVDGLTARVGDIESTVTVEMDAKIGTIADAVEVVLRKPLYHYPIDTTGLESMTEGEVIELAQSLAILRPLVPYPKWRFDADWTNPDMAFLMRKRLWEYFRDRKREAPITVPWHYGTRLCLYLGNDTSRQIYIAGCIDPNELAFLDRLLQPGMTFIDAGANEGVYTVLAAQRTGPDGTVWAFEPSQREMARLQHNLELNSLRARVFSSALAEREGTAELCVSQYEHEGLNTLGGFVHEVEQAHKEVVRLSRLDDVIGGNPLERLDVVKIDVEGAELRLLQGAAETLRRYRPILMFEASEASLRQQGASCGELFQYLTSHDYLLSLFDPYSGLPAPATPGVSSDNMIAVPAGVSLPGEVYRPWRMTGGA